MCIFLAGMLTMAVIDLVTVVVLRRKFRAALDLLIARVR